ncbi:winged helix-turn-helix transcriptional regulator [Nocardioides anomalus]|uniref:Winged helix-turn-helix transcriptional regulator n=1 Tax=Nocardioides anomalus TaxID=2712223 RepID=A0A6G6WCR9_9ACTN|nr:MarR family winged helix-turn-helix transcriptional regulator [Nocardioides anomalus]QIG43024.1 winged helix-turn-helix transcriptional regulator [Nocardioides anomalus]
MADDPALALYVAVARLVRSLRQEVPGSAVGPGGLSVLVALDGQGDGQGPQRIGTLAETIGVTAPSMTRIVNALEAEGLVVRRADPLDGRAQVVAATPEGRRLVGSGREAKLAALRRRLAELPPADRERVEAALPALEILGGAVLDGR